MTTDAGERLIQEELIKRVEEIRDRLAELDCPVDYLNAWIEEQKQLLQK